MNNICVCIVTCFCLFIFCDICLGTEAGIELLKILPETSDQGELLEVEGKFVRAEPFDPCDLIKSIRIESLNNDNTLYTIWLRVTDIPRQEHHGFVLKARDVVLRSYISYASEEKVHNIAFSCVDKSIADKVALVLGVKPELREHPGHQLLVRFWKHDDSNLVTVGITNMGKKTVKFQTGGRGRGPRNNRFGFVAFCNNEPVKDIGSPINFGGLTGNEILEPGETFTKDTDLTDWFDLSKEGNYAVLGFYHLEFERLPGEAKYLHTLWEDYAVAKFGFEVK